MISKLLCYVLRWRRLLTRALATQTVFASLTRMSASNVCSIAIVFCQCVPGVRLVGVSRSPCLRAIPKPQARLLCGVLLLANLLNVTAAVTFSFAQSAGTIGTQPDNAWIIAKDRDARYLVSGRIPPYQAIGRVTGSMTCTGAIVLHPRIVLTTAHCVVGITGAPLSRGLFFRPAYEGGTNIFEGKVEAIGSARQRGPQTIHDASQDWAILVLDKELPGVRPLSIVEYPPQELASMHRRVLLPSYSLDLAEGQALGVDPSCSIDGVKWEVLLHDCAAGAGSAGAPLLVRDQDCYAVLGIHSGVMLARDLENHTLQFAGNSAIGTWNFSGHAHEIAARLEADKGAEHAKSWSSNACSFETADTLHGDFLRPSLASRRF